MPPADTLPNAAFIDDPAVVSDKRLNSANLAIFEGTVTELSFRHNFNFEASDTNPNLGFDGGVLEYSTDGGNTFQYSPCYEFRSRRLQPHYQHRSRQSDCRSHGLERQFGWFRDERGKSQPIFPRRPLSLANGQ